MSQYSGKVPVKNDLAKLTAIAPSAAPISVPRPPTATQIAASIEFSGRKLARVDDADLRHVERAAPRRR